jgi:murein DD-endopeptidase MepM/ murein hydrolase activator NlpD
VPHRAEARSAGRHRRDPRPRHRAPRIPLPTHARQTVGIAGERHRTALLTATLGAALVAGVAGGTAAAAANQPARAAAAVVTAPHNAASADAPPYGATTATPPSPDVEPHLQADPSVPAPPADLSAVPTRQKARPKPVAPREAGAAWVHPNPAAQVTSCFGPRWGRLHAGVDLAAPNGTAIVAAGAGVVVRAGEAGGYGIAVLIDHGNGYLTHYGHLSAVTVTAGQRVVAGQQIGDEGSTGHSTGPHLHFEVHQGYFQNPVEPTAWMREHGVDIPGC